MATITKTPSNTWKAIIRKRGWPTTIKTFRTKRDAQDWARRTEDDTVRLKLSLLSHLFTIAIKKWRVGLFYNPVANIRKPTPGKGRDRRLRTDEEQSLLKACVSTHF